MTATIKSLCIGMPRVVQDNGKDVLTGIWKYPVEDPVQVGKLGIQGDGQADLTVHGGRDKAVYVYPDSHYPAWEKEIGAEALEPAQFGENLTVTEVDESNVHIGDRFRFGTVEAVVAQPRLPCFKLAIRMGDKTFPQRFLKSGRLGFYLRIDTGGETRAGDAFERIGRAGHEFTISRLWQTVFGERDADDAARALELLPHLDEGWERRLRMIARP